MSNTKEVVADEELVAYCGLYCGACESYLKGSCPGCRKNSKAYWCKVRTCCIESEYNSCADCGDYPDVQECGKFNSFMMKFLSFLFRTNRKSCIDKIKLTGTDAFSWEMAQKEERTVRW